MEIGKGDGACKYYQSSRESVDHLFFGCIRAVHYWNSIAIYHGLNANSLIS